MVSDEDPQEIILSKYRNAEHWKNVLDGCDVLVAGDRLSKIAVIISGLSSGLNKKIHLYAMGRSQSGKSWTQERIGSHLFPNFEEINSSSAKAPYYESKENPEAFRNTIKMYDEFANQSEELQNQIKAFTSQGIDSATLKTVDKKREYLKAKIEGLPVIWTNSATPIESEQILNRFWKFNVDETLIQDKIIHEYQQEEDLLGDMTERELEKIKQAKAEISFIFNTKNLKILNPFALCWEVRTKANRNMRPMIRAIINVLAYSNRMIRPHINEDTILASLSDNIIAFFIWSSFEIYQLKKVPERYLKLLNVLNSNERYYNEQLADAYKEKYPDEDPLSPDTCYQYAYKMEKLNLMGSIKDGNKKIWFPLTSAHSTSKTKYGSNGTLACLIFESLEVRFPTIEELTAVLRRIENASLAKNQNTECFEDLEGLARQLFDWDFLYILGKTLDFDIPKQTGYASEKSNSGILDLLEFNEPDQATNSNTPILDSNSCLNESIAFVKNQYEKGTPIDNIIKIVGKELIEECHKRGIIPRIGGGP